MRIRLAVPEDLNEEERKAVLDTALEAVTLAQVPLLERGKIPAAHTAIKQGRVRWRPEPPGDEHFDLAKTVLGRGWGDCDDLAPWTAATLRASGVDPEARAVVRKSGPNRWHAVVERSSGKVDDPSRWAGMGGVGGDEYSGPFWSPMWGDRLSLATLPLQRGWAGRVDVPSTTLPMLYSALSRGSTPARAVLGACSGAVHVAGEDADPVDLVRLAGLADLLRGVPKRDVGAALEQIGFLPGLTSLVPAAASLAAPVLSKLLPGQAAPGAAAPGGGGGGMAPGSTLHCPGGPIIVRF